MDAERLARYRQAAIAYALAGAVGLGVAGLLVPARPVLPVLLLPSGLIVMVLAYFVSRGVRWLSLGLAALAGLRAALHLLCYVWPEPLFWSIRPLNWSVQLADGSRNGAYLASGGLLAFAAVLLMRAAWRRSVAVPATPAQVPPVP